MAADLLRVFLAHSIALVHDADRWHGTHTQDVRKQLLQTMDRYKLDLVSAGRDQKKILMAVTSGFFFHAARKDPQEVHARSCLH